MIKQRRVRWAGYIARMGDMRNAYYMSVEKHEWKRPVRRLWRRWDDNTAMDRRDTGWEVVDRIHMAQDRAHRQVTTNTVMNLRAPLKAQNFLTSLTTGSFLRRTLLRGVG